MKKVFLLFGMAAFYSASAQQKGVFDIQRHLDNLKKDKKIPGVGNKPFDKTTLVINYGFPLYSQKLSHVLSNGDRVYILSQDNMPCVVPGIPQNNIPNISNPNAYFQSPLFKNDSPGSIPNAVKPYRLIVSK